jgi:hypothetical protein
MTIFGCWREVDCRDNKVAWEGACPHYLVMMDFRTQGENVLIGPKTTLGSFD